MTEIDRSGDPDELLDRVEAAQLLGYSGPKVIDSYRARNTGYSPIPTTPDHCAGAGDAVGIRRPSLPPRPRRS